MSFFVVLMMGKDAFHGKLRQTFERPFKLSGDWEMAVASLALDKSQSVFVFCDLVGYTFVNDAQMQYLDFYSPSAIRKNSPQYVKVEKKRFSCINVDILNINGDETFRLDHDITCVLHFRKA